MLEVFKPGALNYFTFFRPILSTLSAFRNPILTPLPLSGLLDSLFCVLIVPTPGMAFSLLIPRTLAAALSFSSGRIYLFLNFLPPFFLRLIPTLIMQGSTSLLTSSPRCHFLISTPPYSLLPDGWQNRFLFSLHWSLLQKSLHSGGLQLPSTLWDSRDTSDPRGEEVFDWVISSDLLLLNDPETPTLLHRSTGSRSSPDIFFAPSSLALSCSWEVLQKLGSDHQPIFLSITLSPVFHPNEHPPSFNFQKARWNDFASYIDSHCSSAEEYSSLSLSSAAALFTSLALNAAKSSIPFGRIKRPPKAWWSAEVEGAVSERRKAFAAAHRSDEDCQAYITVSRRALSVIAKAKAEACGRRLALLFHLNLTLNLYTLFFAQSLALLPRLPPLLTFLTVLLPGNRLRSMPLTWDLTFPFLSQRLCVAEPEATSLSSAEPRALWSLTRLFALLSLPLNFLRLPPIFSRPPPLAKTKLPIPC